MPDPSNFKADHDHSDDDGVKWLPPWSFAAHGRWAEAHPWLAGFYFGVFFGLLFALFSSIMFAEYAAILRSVRVAVLVGGLTCVVVGRCSRLDSSVDGGNDPATRPWI